MTFTYGNGNWLDQLTGVTITNHNGRTTSSSITYDAIGNPLSYYNGTSYALTWRNGRELDTLTTGGKTTSYEYDVNGLRTLKRNADGGYSVYYWAGDLLLAERRVPAAGSTVPARTLMFNYDENNSPVGFQFKSDVSNYWYFYVFAKNAQGDITSIYRRDVDANGKKYLSHIADYEYDPWGRVLSVRDDSGRDISNESNDW